MKLSMIVPIFQEESRLPDGLSDLQSFLARLPLALELILVCEPGEGASVRASVGAVAAAAKSPRRLSLNETSSESTPAATPGVSTIAVKVLENARRLGRGPSVQRGLDEASGDLLIVLSADMNIPLAESFAAVQEYLRAPEDTGFVLGNRRSLKRPRHGERSALKKIFDDIEHEKAQGLDVPDPTSPFWAITRELWQKVSPQMKFRRWYYTPQLVRYLREMRAPIKSLDINSHDDPSTRFKWWHSILS